MEEGKEGRKKVKNVSKKGWGGTKREGTGMKGRRGEGREREERFHLRKQSHHNMDDSGA